MTDLTGIKSVCKTEPKLTDEKPKMRIVGETYAVEKIVGIKMMETGEKLYKVRWKGFAESEDTWEPYENLTDGCDRLIHEYELSQKAKYDENGEHSRASTSRSNEISENSSERSSSRQTHTGGHWEYETVEVLTPDEWNRFGNVENRELGGLYIPDRIPTETEKLLCNLAPDLGRVTRNKLKAVMKTESSPLKESVPVRKGTAKSRGRGGKESGTLAAGSKISCDDGQRSVFKEKSKALASNSVDEESANESFQPATFPETAVPTKAELPDDALLSQFSPEGALQIAAADTSTEGDELFRTPSQASGEIRGTNRNSAKRGGRGKGGGVRGRKRGGPKRGTSRAGSSEDAVSSATFDEQRSTSMEVTEEISSLVTDEQSQKQSEAAVSQVDGRRGSSVRRRTSSPAAGRSGTCGTRGTATKTKANRGKRATTPRRTKTSGNADEKRQPGRSSKGSSNRKRKASTAVDDIASDDSTHSIDDGTLKRSEIPSIPGTSDDVFSALDDEPEEPEADVSALEMFTCETRELPISLTNAPISAIEIATIRRHQQNREKPLQTFEQFRSAVLSNQLSAVKWTGRCVPERRGFDFNQKYRGKTVAIELCERPCGPTHETDDMLRQIVRDGARLDIPDDTRGRIPLHFAVSCEFWCRVRTLLHLRSPVNTEDKDKKTPLQLAMLTRTPSFEVTRTIYLLLEYGADVNEVMKKMAPLRNRYVPNLIEHQQRLSQAFDEARMKTLVDITVKRILLPVTVRAMWEFESTDWTTEIGFNHETFQFPNNRYAYMILLAVFDYRSARFWRVRMWGESPFADVQMNDSPVESLTNNPKGFVYVTSLINGWNKLKIKFQPYVKKKKLLLMAQVLLIQLHKPAPYIPRPALEVAPESGTDWRHD